jgi:hypothetical protein
VDALGVRAEGSSWLGSGGLDVNFDFLYFFRSR